MEASTLKPFLRFSAFVLLLCTICQIMAFIHPDPLFRVPRGNCSSSVHMSSSWPRIGNDDSFGAYRCDVNSLLHCAINGHPTEVGTCVPWVSLPGPHRCAAESRMTLWQSANPFPVWLFVFHAHLQLRILTPSVTSHW